MILTDTVKQCLEIAMGHHCEKQFLHAVPEFVSLDFMLSEDRSYLRSIILLEKGEETLQVCQSRSICPFAQHKSWARLPHAQPLHALEVSSGSHGGRRGPGALPFGTQHLAGLDTGQALPYVPGLVTGTASIPKPQASVLVSRPCLASPV